MIISFKHRGLKRLYARGDRSGIRPDMVQKVERILARLDEIDEAKHMDLPGYRLHGLTGELRGYWSVTVNANWRILFAMDGHNVIDVDLIDYH